MYSYNSYHKVITGVIIVGWAIFHFSQRSTEDSPVYDNGQVICSGEKINSLNEGVWTWYFEDGSIQMKGNFSRGKRTGTWKTYSKDGNLISESNYENNKLNGPSFKYDEHGHTVSEVMYKNDVLVSRKSQNE